MHQCNEHEHKSTLHLLVVIAFCRHLVSDIQYCYASSNTLISHYYTGPVIEAILTTLAQILYTVATLASHSRSFPSDKPVNLHPVTWCPTLLPMQSNSCSQHRVLYDA